MLIEGALFSIKGPIPNVARSQPSVIMGKVEQQTNNYIFALGCIYYVAIAIHITYLFGHLYICYSYIPLRVGYHCYYTSPRQSRGRVLITMISYECSGI